MKFHLYKDLMTQDGKEITWVEAGVYEIERMFDKRRVLILLDPYGCKRQLAIVPVNRGAILAK